MQHDTDSSLFLVWKVDTPQESHAQNLIWACERTYAQHRYNIDIQYIYTTNQPVK
jgi:hypothetical protein